MTTSGNSRNVTGTRRFLELGRRASETLVSVGAAVQRARAAEAVALFYGDDAVARFRDRRG